LRRHERVRRAGGPAPLGSGWGYGGGGALGFFPFRVLARAGGPASPGGEATTRVFDRLAKSGLRYTDFHTHAICAASRAAMLTGRNGHSVGFGCLPETAVGFSGYNTIHPPKAPDVLEILRMNGYGTAWIG